MTLTPIQLTFCGLAHSDTLETSIRERIAGLEQFYSDIVRCGVLVEVPHRHRHDGRHFHVRIEITVPGGLRRGHGPQASTVRVKGTTTSGHERGDWAAALPSLT